MNKSFSYYFSLQRRLLLYFFIIFGIPFRAGSTIHISKNYSLQPDTIVIKQKDSTITYIPIYKQKNKSDSILQKKDPIVNFFNRNASKSQVNKWIYDLLVNEHKPKKPSKDIDYSKDFAQIKDKPIKHIYFKRLPPFGPSINDTTKVTRGWLAKVGNSTRIPTSTLILKNNITLKEGQLVTQKKIEESERLLRQLGYISGAKILIRKNENDTNYIDVIVISKDQFPHAFDLGLIHSYPKVRIYSTNLFGQGLGFSQTVIFAPKNDPVHGFATGLRVKNFYGSLIDLSSLYTKRNNLHDIYFKANRDFYRFDTKNAGGISIDRSFKNYNISGSEQIDIDTSFNYLISNLWYGHSFNIKSSNRYLDKSKLYFSVQNINSKFYNVADSLSIYPYFSNNHFYFAAITLAKRNYFQNNLIYSFGRTEDVPFGFMTSFTYGYNYNNKGNRHFIGFHFNSGKTIVPNRGYIAYSIDATTFFKGDRLEQGTIRLTASYISRLIYLHCCKLRSFIDVWYLKGINRLPFEYTYLRQTRQGITGFVSSVVRGKEKFVIKTENVFFRPKKIWGFQFAFFSFTDIGFIGNSNVMVFNSKPYLSFGGGIKIRNDNLVFKTVQLRIAILPIVPPGQEFYNVDVAGKVTRKFNDFYPKEPFKPTFY